VGAAPRATTARGCGCCGCNCGGAAAADEAWLPQTLAPGFAVAPQRSPLRAPLERVAAQRALAGAVPEAAAEAQQRSVIRGKLGNEGSKNTNDD